MTSEKPTVKDLVAAIRSDKAVGHGSCSSIDECWEDSELAEAMIADNVSTVADAVKWARALEGLWLDRACDARWGDDDDPQLKWKADFENRCRENPE